MAKKDYILKRCPLCGAMPDILTKRVTGTIMEHEDTYVRCSNCGFGIGVRIRVNVTGENKKVDNLAFRWNNLDQHTADEIKNLPRVEAGTFLGEEEYLIYQPNKRY